MSVIRTEPSYRGLRRLWSAPYNRGSRIVRRLFGWPPDNTSNPEVTHNNGAVPSTEEMGQNEGPAEDVAENPTNNVGEPRHVDAEPGPAPVIISSGGSGDEGARSLPATSPSAGGIDIATRNLQTVSAFLAENGNRRLNLVECAGLVSLLQGSVVEEDEPREPFRFSSSPATTTPAFTFVPTSSSAPAFPGMTSAPQASKKLLTKNPNGSYRWHGGGSARPKNRYRSPAFGPSGSAPSRMKIPMENPITTKRRRVEEPSTSSAVNSTPATTSLPQSQEGPSTTKPTAPKINGTTPSMSAPVSAASTSRHAGPTPPVPAPTIRTNNLPPKVSAPAVPSPLRQTWGQTDPPSPPQPAPVSRPTRAANIMTEIIKEAAPRPKPAFQNPYQAACPVPLKPTTRKPLPRKPRVAPTKPTPAPKEVELSPQKIIEATVPKGSKRLRPPPEFDLVKEPKSQNDSILSSSPRRKSPEPFRTNGINGVSRSPNGHSTKRSSVQVEEVSDEDMPSPPKKQKPAPPAAPKLSARFVPPPVIIEEVEDVDMPAKVEHPSQIVEPGETQPQQRSTSPTSSLGALPNGNAAAKAAYGLKSSAPKAPSKLRYSFQAEKEDKEGEKSQSKNKGTSPFTFGATHPKPYARPAPKTKQEVRTTVMALPTLDLPTFAFDVPTSSPGAGPGPSSQKSRNAAMATSKTSLPTYDFSAPAPVASFSIPATAPAPAPAPTAFNWTAAGMKAPTQQSTGGTWTCSQCMLSNPDSAKDQCTICDAPRPGKAKPAPAPAAFNWSAAGMKAPTQATGGTWTCSECMLSNPDSATTQCTICEAPRPGKAAPAPAVKAFDWAAAGMKKPQAASTGSWTCSVCALSNPASATDKCTVCDTPR